MIFIKMINIIFITIYLFACSEVIEKENNIDNRITGSMTLQETDSIVLVSIDKVVFDYEYMYILDEADSKILKYNRKNGIIVDQITFPKSISDSAALFCFPSRRGDSLLTHRQTKLLDDFDPNRFFFKLKSRILDIFIEEDILYYTMNIMSYAYNSNPDSIIRSKYYKAISPGLIKYDLITQEENFYPVYHNWDIISQANSIYWDKPKKQYYITCYDYNTPETNYVVFSYDTNFVPRRKILELPDEYVESGCSYYINFAPYFSNIDDDVYVAFPYSEQIINIENTKQIDIPALEFSNDEIFKKVSNNELRKDSILFYLQNRVIGLHSNKSKNLMVIVDKYYLDSLSNRYSKFTVIEIDVDGNLIAKLDVDSKNRSGTVKHISYSQAENRIVVFRKSKMDWTVENINWK